MELIGEWYNKTLDKCVRIINHQFENRITKGIKGFIFYGPPGNGKTTLAKKVVEGVALKNDWKKQMVFKDCADLAMPKYGDTERAIRDVFVNGRNKTIHPIIYIFDDADGLFITRDFGPKLDAWYIGQLNVLFHELDKMDTSNESVILTTNRIDLLDKALLDRLYSIQFPDPPKSVLEMAAVELTLNKLKLNKRIVERFKNIIHDDEKIITFRDMEREIYDLYIEYIESSEDIN